MAFRIGQPVECVGEFNLWHKILFPDIHYPSIGSKYTIREQFTHGSDSYLLLQEIRNPDVPYNRDRLEAAWPAEHFRPLTDISALTKLTKVRELEDA